MNTQTASPSYLSQLKNEYRYTTDHLLALSVAKLSGKLPIEHISPRVREAYRIAYPELLEPQGKSGSGEEK